jgi:arsenate reductase-like glutaredoxin family protein
MNADIELRDLTKVPLTLDELRVLARRVGGASALVAPKKAKEANGLDGEALLGWLAEDMGRARRPIIDLGGKVLLGFNAEILRNVQIRL